MTVFNAGGLDARNIGSTISYSNAEAEYLGTIVSITKTKGTGLVKIALAGGPVLDVTRDTKVDITLPPGAHFQRESSETLGQTRELMRLALAELEDLSDDVVEYLEGKARASAVDLVIGGAVPPVPSPSAVAAVMGARAAVGATL